MLSFVGFFFSKTKQNQTKAKDLQTSFENAETKTFPPLLSSQFLSASRISSSDTREYEQETQMLLFSTNSTAFLKPFSLAMFANAPV